MNNEQIKKQEIESALAKIPDSNFLETTKGLPAVLGYRNQRTLNLSGNVDDFIQMLLARTQDTEAEREFRVEVESVKPVFQVTDDEIVASNQGTLFESPAFDDGEAKSFMFFAVELKGKDYPRGKYWLGKYHQRMATRSCGRKNCAICSIMHKRSTLP